MIKAQYINLNMIPSGVMPVMYCSQYDIGRPLGMVVYNGSEYVNLDSYTCTIEATRTDGTAITAAVTTDGNIGAFVTTATMTNQADKYMAKLVLFDSNSRRVASLAFVMCITVATMDENAESIEEDESLYQQYTETVQTLIADIRLQLTDLENHLDTVENVLIREREQTHYKIVAHRGYPNASNIYAQDNSQAAFASAGAAGFNAIEGDPRKDKNGVIVMLHDETVDSVSWQSGDISQLSYAEVYYKTNAGHPTQNHLCTLNDMIAIAKFFGMTVFFDMGKNVCTISEIVSACEALDFYNIAFFGLEDDTEFLTAPDYVIKILGGYTFNPDATAVTNYVRDYGTKNYGVRIRPNITDSALANIVNSGLMTFGTEVETTDYTYAWSEYALSTLDYILTNYPMYLSKGISYLSGAYTRMQGSANLVQVYNKVENRNGLTITCNDGLVTLDGLWGISENGVIEIGYCYLKAGNYILTGVPVSGIDTGYRLQILNPQGTSLGYDLGYGFKFTAGEEEWYLLRIHVLASSAKLVSNLTFRPMVRSSAIISDGYSIFAPTNKMLFDAITEAEKIAGCYNFIHFDSDVGKTWYGLSYAINADDGTITLNGKFESDTNRNITIATLKLHAGKRYVFADEIPRIANETGIDLWLVSDDPSDVRKVTEARGFTAVSDTYNLQLRGVSNEATYVTNLTLKPFVCLQNLYAGFHPGTLTNRELTKRLAQLETRVAALE